MNQRTLYVAAEETAHQSGRLVSLAAASPSGAWFYAEVTDIDGARCSQRVRDCVIPQLRKVTDTVFVKSVNLGSAFAGWIAQHAPGDIEIRALCDEAVHASFLRDLLMGQGVAASRLSAGECEVDHAAFEIGLARCGGEPKVGGSAIIRAVLTAVCDKRRQEPIGTLNTRRFELLMGTRNATSLRAWIRRHERMLGAAAVKNRCASPSRREREHVERASV